MNYIEISGGLHDGARFADKHAEWTVGSSEFSTVLLLDDGVPEHLLHVIINDDGDAVLQYADDECVFSLNDQPVAIAPQSVIPRHTVITWRSLQFGLKLAPKKIPVALIDPATLIGAETAAADADLFGQQLRGEERMPHASPKSLVKSSSFNAGLLWMKQHWVGTALACSLLVLAGYQWLGRGDQANMASRESERAVAGADGFGGFEPYAFRDVSGSTRLASAGSDQLRLKRTDFIDERSVESAKRQYTYISAAKDALDNGLASAKLDDLLTVAVQGQQIDIKGTLNQADRRRFERVLKNVVEDYGTQIALKAQIAAAQDSVDIIVRQVVGGTNPMVVLDDGSRLYVGSQYRGSTVESISTNKLVLRGAELIEVAI